MVAMKKLDESGPARPVIFVAVNLINLPSSMLPTVLSTSNNQTINDDNNVHHWLTILEMQMAEMMADKMTSASFPAPTELQTLRKLPSLQGAWSRVRQPFQQVPHFIQQPRVQQSPAQHHRAMYSDKVLQMHLQRHCEGQNGKQYARIRSGMLSMASIPSRQSLADMTLWYSMFYKIVV